MFIVILLYCITALLLEQLYCFTALLHYYYIVLLIISMSHNLVYVNEINPALVTKNLFLTKLVFKKKITIFFFTKTESYCYIILYVIPFFTITFILGIYFAVYSLDRNVILYLI